MLKYPLPRGKVRLKDLIPLISDALYPEEKDRNCALKRVRQAIKDGRKAKKNPLLLPGCVFNDKDFFRWALKRWPILSEKIEGIPQYVLAYWYADQECSLDVYNIDNPADLEILVELYLKKRLADEERLGDYLADLKRAFVKAEFQCDELLKDNERIVAESAELRDKLGAFERRAAEISTKCSESGKKKKGCKHEKG